MDVSRTIRTYARTLVAGTLSNKPWGGAKHVKSWIDPILARKATGAALACIIPDIVARSAFGALSIHHGGTILFLEADVSFLSTTPTAATLRILNIATGVRIAS